MNKTELKTLIKECYRELIKEDLSQTCSTEADQFVDNIDKIKFLKSLVSKGDTKKYEGVWVSNDSDFYFTLGEFVGKDKTFSDYYDKLSDDDQCDLNEYIGEKLADKFDIEF
jgi:hypothetical protein